MHLASSPLGMSAPASPLSGPLQGKMILAPLTRGGNLPFRRLCADFGMEVSFGEMVFARNLLKHNDLIEHARLRRAANEQFFGVQIATNDIEEGIGAAKLAAEAGADFVDLNCGCPIHEATRRGLGSALLRKPKRLASLVEALVGGSPLPVSVKVRTAAEGGEINIRENAAGLFDAGAAALTIHGRTAQDRYTKAADWDLIAEVVRDGRSHPRGCPVVGNGDLLTEWDARRRMAESGVDAVMVGRGALIKPWLFGEFARGEAWDPTPEERVGVYRQLTAHMQEHFGDDARGRRKAWNFLPWHLDFFCRHVAAHHLEHGAGPAAGGAHEPTMQTRLDVARDALPPLERLLLHQGAPQTHTILAASHSCPFLEAKGWPPQRGKTGASLTRAPPPTTAAQRPPCTSRWRRACGRRAQTPTPWSRSRASPRAARSSGPRRRRRRGARRRPGMTSSPTSRATRRRSGAAAGAGASGRRSRSGPRRRSPRSGPSAPRSARSPERRRTTTGRGVSFLVCTAR